MPLRLTAMPPSCRSFEKILAWKGLAVYEDPAWLLPVCNELAVKMTSSLYL